MKKLVLHICNYSILNYSGYGNYETNLCVYRNSNTFIFLIPYIANMISTDKYRYMILNKIDPQDMFCNHP